MIKSGGFGLYLGREIFHRKLGFKFERDLDQWIDKMLDLYDEEDECSLAATEYVVDHGSIPQSVLFFALMVGMRDLATSREMLNNNTFEQESYVDEIDREKL